MAWAADAELEATTLRNWPTMGISWTIALIGKDEAIKCDRTLARRYLYRNSVCQVGLAGS